MKVIIFVLIIAAAVWAYFNVDFANMGSNMENTIKQEKTIKKFWNADQQNKDELNKTLQENF